MRLSITNPRKNLSCPTCQGIEFQGFERLENNRARAICQNCGEEVWFFGASLIEDPMPCGEAD